MHIQFVPLLRTQRDLYQTSRGWERFRQYLAAMQPGTDDQLAPMFVMNPMAKEHVAARLDELLAIDADGVAAAAAAAAGERLPNVDGDYKAGLVVADDVHGGWTNRFLSEAQLRFGYMHTPQQRAKLATSRGKGWIVGMLWAGEETTADHVREVIRAAVYRTAYIQCHGLPMTLKQMLAQEGLARAFARAAPPPMDHDELAYSHEVISPYLDVTDFPTAFACLYGDAAAQSVGYPALGLAPFAGYSVATIAVEEYLRRTGQSAEKALVKGEHAIFETI